MMLIRRAILVATVSALSVAAGPALADSHDTDIPNGGFEASTLGPPLAKSNSPLAQSIASRI